MAHSASYQKDMADIDEQIAMVQFLQAQNMPTGTAEERNAQQIAELKAQKAGKAAEFKQEKLNKAENARGFATVGAIAQGLKGNAYGANRALANVPTPGGIGVPIFILLFLYFILFPVNGHTRMYWLFLVLFGHASLGTVNRGTNPFWDSGGQQGGNGNNTGQGTNITGGLNSVSQDIRGSFTPGINPFQQNQTGSVSTNANSGQYTQIPVGNGTVDNVYTGNVLPFFGYNALEQINGQ